ncbi:MmpL protein [Mycobacterium bohemicum]|nr:MmpL protein [Mycobacterium bohemicum]
MPVPTTRPDAGETGGNAADPTAALPVMRPDGNDADAATEKLNTRADADTANAPDAPNAPNNGDPSRQRRRAGGGVSAQDLLRREGRL